MPANDVKLLKYRRRSERQPAANIRQAVSEDCLFNNRELEEDRGPGFSMLKLSKTRISVGDSVTVYWDIREQCGADDWIGLFDFDSPTSLSNYLDSKQRGVTGAKRGAIKWAINRDVTFGEVENKCIFKYVHGKSCSVRAISPTLYIHNPFAELTSPYGRGQLGSLVPEETLLEFSITGLQADGLKKSIFGKPSPYVKLSIMPSRRHLRSWKQHHGQIAKTSFQTNTINPNWTSEEFVFLGGAEDLLEIEVRNKFSGTRPAFSRFLGKLTIPLVDLFRCQRNRPEEFSKVLGRRTPADRVQGTINLVVTVIEPNTRPSVDQAAEQENIAPTTPPGAGTGATQSNPLSALSNPSLTSSAPNILQPLTLNSIDGVLETAFPVDHTPSPVSPFEPLGQENASSDSSGHCRRRLPMQFRPFSELYAEDVGHLDSDMGTTEITPNLEEASNENTASDGEASNADNLIEISTLSDLVNCVDTGPANGATDHVNNLPNVVDGTDSGMLMSTSEPSQNNVESQPMEITGDIDNVEGPGVVTQNPVINDDAGNIGVSLRNSIGSTGSIELTEDSPLRILEESERVREEIALSSENLLQDPVTESDDELERMDVTDDTSAREQDSSAATDCSMEDVLNDQTGTEEFPVVIGNQSIRPQGVVDQRIESLLDEATGSLVDDDGPSSTALHGLPGPSISPALQEDETQPAMVTTPAGAVQPRESQILNSSQQDTSMSLLEFVDHIVGNESAEGSNDNSMIVESAGDAAQVVSTVDAGATNVNLSAQTSAPEVAAVTLPVVASEPVCLDAASLQSSSTSTMLIDTPGIVTLTGNNEAHPQRPPRSKRLSRSNSEPRNSHSRRRSERVRNSPGGTNQGEYSPGLSRPPFVRRITDPVARQINLQPAMMAVNNSNNAPLSTQSLSSSGPLSPTESVVMAVPLSPPPQRLTSSGLTSVVVADGIIEPDAVVTPLVLPNLDSGEESSIFTSAHSTAVAAPVISEVNMATSPRTREVFDFVLISTADEGRQPSSAPSTLQRDVIPARATVLANTLQTSPRRSVVQSTPRSHVIHAISVSGAVENSTSASFPRQRSAARVTPLLTNGKQRPGGDSSSSSQARAVNDSLQSFPSDNSHVVTVMNSSIAQSSRDTSETSSSNTTERGHNSSSCSAASSAITDVVVNPPQRSPQIQPSNVPQGSLSSQSGQETGVERRAVGTYPHRRGRRSSAQREHSVHVSIQDQRQTARSEQHTDPEEPLPSNWERGVDSHGRVYYIDHVNRTTTWVRPRQNAPESESNMNEINTHWQSLDRRYQSFRRTLRGRTNRNSRVPLPMETNRESQTTAESSGNGTEESGAASPRPSSAGASTSSTLPSASTTPIDVASPSPPTASVARAASLMQSPGVKFLTRHDFIDFLKSKGVAGQYYFQSQMLKLIVSKIRSEPSQFDRYRHQVELVRFLNQFADPQMDMPPGWDKKVDQSGRLYFIDHNSRTTTFIDPRLPVEETLSRPRSRTDTEQPGRAVLPPRPPPPRAPTRSSSLSSPTPLTYNQQIVGFLSQPNVESIIKTKYPTYTRSPSLKANVRRVQTDGERALGRLSNNVDFIMLLSVMEENIMSYAPPDVTAQIEEPTPSTTSPTRSQASTGTRTRANTTELPLKGSGADSSSSSSSSSSTSPAPYKRDFEAKVRSFHRQLYHKGYGQGPNKIKLSVRRDHILEDAYDQIMKEPARALQRNRLEVQFAGEEGLDYGGPAREFFFLLSRQVFNPYYGLFEYSANDTYTVQVSPVSLYVDNSHEWFRFCGRIIGLVIIHQHLLDAFFTRPFYKALLRSPCDLSDVEAMDSLFHQSMTWMTENDITGALDLSFTVSEEIFGQVTERELIPGGKEIEVTEQNKQEYVDQMVRWRVERGVAEQTESIVKGFNEVLDPNLINLFDARELELVISGTADIDIEDWRKNTEYRSGYHGNHKVIRWFWKGVRSFDNEQRLRLLQFVTGTSSIPYEGFAALRGSTGPRKFCIERWGEFSKLPRAHTCFNRLDLPLYRTYEELLEKLTFAVEESETFAMQ
ncbi:E3 ubiquitin-protein ligase HECW2-like isoform X1 [Acropora muricata]|uniref:E3 ubiquitin-protein ligase HECW2-like isoform X1 n=1 Tax=Acropora muricata TaxID=159855 RepID=UPI0034E57B35